MTDENMQDEMKKQMEEQMKAQKEAQKLQLKMNLKQIDANRKIVSASIVRMKAEKDVLEKVDLPAEENAVKKKLIEVKAAEIDALLEGEDLKLEMLDETEKAMKSQLENIDKMPMRPQGMPGMM